MHHVLLHQHQQNIIRMHLSIYKMLLNVLSSVRKQEEIYHMEYKLNKRLIHVGLMISMFGDFL
jgi:hypothetical protein